MSAAKSKKPDQPESEMLDGAPIVKKIITAYPFPVQIFKEQGVPGIVGQVQKITTSGMLVKLPSLKYLTVSTNLSVTFQMTQSERICHADVKLVKTYQEIDQYAHHENEKTYVAEFHYRMLPPEVRLEIKEFISKFKQKA